MADEHLRGRPSVRADSSSSSCSEECSPQQDCLSPQSDPSFNEHDDLVNRRFGSHIRDMSPRRTSEDIEALGRETREELQRHAKALQDSLMIILNRIEAVKKEHDKLDINNQFLQKYIGDLMSTTKITATGGRGMK